MALRWRVLLMVIAAGLSGGGSAIAHTEQEMALLNAVKFGHLEKVDELLRSGVSPDAEVGRMSALWMAATIGNDAIVGRLLGGGATADRSSADGTTPLMQAAYLGRTPVVRRLIAADADPKPALQALLTGLMRRDRGAWLEGLGKLAGDTVMTWLPRTNVVASATEITNLLSAAVVPYEIFRAADRGNATDLLAAFARAELAVGSTAIPRAPDGKVLLNETRLWRARSKAVERNQVSVIELLLQLARPSPTWFECDSLLERAARDARLPMVQALIANGVRTRSHVPLLAALQDFHDNPVLRTEVVKQLLEVCDGSNVRALEGAATSGATEVVRLLLAAGAPPNNYPGSPSTPLHAAATDSIVRLLAAAGADVNREALGYTPLNHHAREGHAAVVRALLAAGAKPDVGGSSLWQAFQGAVDPGVVWALAAAGADPSAPPYLAPRPQNQTLLGLAATKLSIDAMNALLSIPAVAARAKGSDGPEAFRSLAEDQQIAPADPRVLPMFQALLAAGASPIANEPWRHCPALGPAAYHGRVEMVRVLLAAGAPANERDRYCKTPLGYLASNALMWTPHQEVAKMLLESGADPNDRAPKRFDCKKWPTYIAPLYWIADHPQVSNLQVELTKREVVRLLLAAKANPNVRGPDGTSAVKAALSHGETKIADAIRQAGGR